MVGLVEVDAKPSPALENKCSGVAAFDTAKTIFHKNPTNHAEAAALAYSTEKGRAYGKKRFDECVGKN